MIKTKKNVGLLLLSLLMVMLSCFTIYAEEKSDVITRVNITVTSSVSAGSEGSVSAQTESSRYYISSCDFMDNKTEWSIGDVPKVKIVLEAEDEFYFYKSMGSSKISIEGAKYYAVRNSKDGQTLELTVKLDPIGGTLGDVSDAYWDEDTLGKARWEEAENANAYEVKLYRNSDMVHHVDRTSGTSYNFFPYMSKKGLYYFRVRAIPRNSSEKDFLDEGNWRESREVDIEQKDADRAASKGKSDYTGAGRPGSAEQYGWIHNKEGWWYRNSNGSYTTNDWQYIDGKWYLFDMGGYMKTGWQTHNDKDYYLNSNGDMATGWFQDNRRWYYFDDTGKKATGWLNLNDRWYFMSPDGTMATGWINLNDKWYYLNPADGVMMTNIEIDGHYVNADGIWIQ